MNIIAEKTESYVPQIPEKVYEEIYSKADIAYLLLDCEGNIVSSNVTAQEKIGYEREELIGKKFLSLIDERDRRRVEEIFLKCVEKGYVRDEEAAIISREKTRIWVKINGLSLNEGQEQRFVRFFIKDVSDLVAEKKQKKLHILFTNLFSGRPISEKLLQKTVVEIEQALGSICTGYVLKKKGRDNILLWTKNDGTDGSQQKFKKWSFEIWNRLFNISKAKKAGELTSFGGVIIRSLSDFMAKVQSEKESDLIVFLAEYETVVLIPVIISESTYGFLILIYSEETRCNKKDIEFLESVLSIFRRKDDRDVNSKPIFNEKASALMNLPIVGVICVQNGKIKYVNSWIERFLESKQNEIVGKSLLEFVSPDSHKILQEISKEADPGSRKTSQEIVVITGNGKQKYVECALNKMGLNGDIIEFWYWVDRCESHNLQNQLIQARKMETLGMLAGGIVHDFNNLLASIIGYSSLLREEIGEDSPHYEDIKQINAISEKAVELTSRLMAHTQGDSYIIDNLDVNQLIKEVAGILSRTLNKNISIKAELNPDLAKIKADASQIQQVILQIALNSRDAMPDGGKIVFKTDNIVFKEDNPYRNKGVKPGKYIQIIISDTGKGMSWQVKEKIFDPSFTTKGTPSVARGTGLSVVKDIIEKHNGFVSVFSEKLKGTVFKIYLPANEEQKLESTSIASKKLSTGEEKILLVDDEEVLRETARKMLTRYGYKVISAESGPEAISIYKKYNDKIDLIILDTFMPGMRIDKILKWIKKLNPQAKVIVAAERGERNNFEDEIGDKLSGVVLKPFQVRPLLEKVRSVLNA